MGENHVTLGRQRFLRCDAETMDQKIGNLNLIKIKHETKHKKYLLFERHH